MLGKDLESMVDESCDLGLRCRSLLMEFQSLRGSEDDDEIGEELKTLLMINIVCRWSHINDQCITDHYR